MNTHAASHDKKTSLLTYAILLVLSVLAALLAVNNIKISPDSMRFGLISQQIISGNGITVPIIRLEENYIPINGAVPFLDQMPLLPMIFALFGGVSANNYLPAQALNLICHVSIAFFTFLFMRRLSNNNFIALLAGSLVAFSLPLLKATHHICSEPLFIAFTVASVYFLSLSRNADQYSFSRNILIAGTCAAASILTRNAGIALIPVFLWQAFILLRNKRPEHQYFSTAISVILPVITTMAMFLRNYMVSGSLRGFSQAPPERSFPDAFTGTVGMIFQQFQLGRNSLLLITFLLTMFTMLIIINSRLRKEFLKYLGGGLDLLLVFTVSYTGLIFITMAKQQWQFELRYVAPLVPFLYLIIIALIVFIWKNIKVTEGSGLAVTGVILSLSILSAGTFYKTFLSLPEFSYKQQKAYSILQSSTYQWIREHYPDNTMIATNKPYHLSFFGGYSTIALPHKRFNPTISVPTDMETVLPDRMSKFGAQVLALFNEIDEQFEGKYIAQLFQQRDDHNKFILVYQCADGVVYNLKPLKD